MEPEQIARWKEEYYDTLAENQALHEILNQDGGFMLARVGSHPPWPARFSEPGEFAKMSRHRVKKGQMCVYFFGTRNYGWVHRTAIMRFSDDYTVHKASKKFSPAMIQRAIAAIAEAKLILNDLDDHHRRFYDRIMERREDPVDMPCKVCNRVDDHFSMLILCDGKDCKREFHMNCLNPPLLTVPPGDWYCPDCAKDPSKQVAENSASGDDMLSADEKESAPGEASVKKSKREKIKSKEPSLKRKLPSGKPKLDVDVSPNATKKHKVQRIKTESPPKSSSRPSTPVQSTRKAMELSMLMNAADEDADIPEHDNHSEERCLICGYGGDLVVCEFFGCTKVYHQFCLGSFPFPKDEDATWYCPRHICAISGEREYAVEAEGQSSKSPRKVSIKRQLWKCATCPLAIADGTMPPIPKSYVLSRSNRKFTCMHCSASAPVKVALAKKIEKIWSMLATNSQGMAFFGPLLPGIELPKSRKEGGKMYLFRVLAKIRRLEYDDSAAFARDIDLVVKEALDIIHDRSVPLAEAARTMKTICAEQMKIHRAKLDALDSKISGLKALSKSKKALEEAFVNSVNGDKRRWPLKWRQECGPFEDRYYPRIEPRSMAEWNAFITSAGLYVNCDTPDSRNGRAYDDSDLESAGGQDGKYRLGRLPRKHRVRDDDSDSDGERTRDCKPPSFPGLTLSEGTDVMLALTELSRSAGGGPKRLGAWSEQEIDEDLTSWDRFLSPSISEMQQMFDQQSVLLRRTLESHSALQKAWVVSQQKMLGLTDGEGLSVGEGRLAAELRLANKNLRARLRNKDKLVDQLTDEQNKLRADVLSLQHELQQAKQRASTMEQAFKSVEDDSAASDGDESTASGDADRKSPRNPAKSKPSSKGKAPMKTPPKPPKKPAAAKS